MMTRALLLVWGILACNLAVLANTQRDAVEHAGKHRGHSSKEEKELKHTYVNDINDCAFMCSIVQTSGCRAHGFNAVFVTARWVLSNQNKVYDWTYGGDKLKNIIVISNTVNVYMDQSATIHRVKKVFFTGMDGEFALLRTSYENHGYANPVPANWDLDTNMAMSIYHFDTYQENIIIHANKMLVDSNTCGSGPTSLCIPTYNEEDVWCTKGAVMVDSNKRLVGLLYSASGGADDQERFDKVSALTPWIINVTTTP